MMLAIRFFFLFWPVFINQASFNPAVFTAFNFFVLFDLLYFLLVWYVLCLCSVSQACKEKP